MTSPGSGRWRLGACAVPGCQHVLSGGIECQDAAKTLQTEDVVAVAVSDGHGASAYPHSAVGSRIAVQVAVDELSAVAATLGEHALASDPVALQAEIGPVLARRVTYAWNRRVAHEAAMRAAFDGEAWPEEIGGDWSEQLQAYGCTLLAAAFTHTHALHLQLGDGAQIVVREGVAEPVFAEAAKIGQETRSLAARGANAHMQIRVVAGPPAFAVLATDGVTDPYTHDPSFSEVWGDEWLGRIREHGWTQAMLGLPRNLGSLARDGDDCTVAVAWFERETG